MHDFECGYIGKQKSRLTWAANELLIRLAEAGDAQLQCELGEGYLFSRMHAPDKNNALAARHWLEKSLAQGNARAAYMLSYLYQYPRKGIPKDLVKAKEYDVQAKDLGYVE